MKLKKLFKLMSACVDANGNPEYCTIEFHSWGKFNGRHDINVSIFAEDLGLCFDGYADPKKIKKHLKRLSNQNEVKKIMAQR